MEFHRNFDLGRNGHAVLLSRLELPGVDRFDSFLIQPLFKRCHHLDYVRLAVDKVRPWRLLLLPIISEIPLLTASEDSSGWSSGLNL